MTYDPSASLKDDWQYTEGVIDAGVAYGSDRATTGLPVAPTSGVKVRKGNPTQNQIAVAASTFGYRSTDQIFTIWLNTLRVTPADESSSQVTLVEGDKITAGGITWIIKSIKETVYATQSIAYCQQSTATQV